MSTFATYTSDDDTTAEYDSFETEETRAKRAMMMAEGIPKVLIGHRRHDERC